MPGGVYNLVGLVLLGGALALPSDSADLDPAGALQRSVDAAKPVAQGWLSGFPLRGPTNVF